MENCSCEQYVGSVAIVMQENPEHQQNGPKIMHISHTFDNTSSHMYRLEEAFCEWSTMTQSFFCPYPRRSSPTVQPLQNGVHWSVLNVLSQ